MHDNSNSNDDYNNNIISIPLHMLTEIDSHGHRFTRTHTVIVLFGCGDTLICRAG